MTGANYRRRKFLVDRKLQFGLSIQIIGYVYLYLVLFALLANFDALKTLILGGGSDEHYMEAVSRLHMFVQVFVVPLIFTLVCMCLHGVLFSHRIAGPIYRLKESLRRIRGGDFAMTVRLRDKDYFGDLCEEMNALLVSLREDMRHLRDASRDLAEEGKSLAASGALPAEARERLASVAEASSRFGDLLGGYRLEEKDTEPSVPADAPQAHLVESGSSLSE